MITHQQNFSTLTFLSTILGSLVQPCIFSYHWVLGALVRRYAVRVLGRDYILTDVTFISVLVPHYIIYYLFHAAE